MIRKNSTNHFQSRSPTSWSIVSEHQPQINTYQSELSTSPSSQDQFIEDQENTPSRTYRLITNDQQPIDGRYVVPSNKYVH
jgi:hypothetical protein